MKTVLIVAGIGEACREIQNVLHPEFKTEVFPGAVPDFSAYKKKSYEFIFVDLDWLKRSALGSGAEQTVLPLFRSTSAKRPLLSAESYETEKRNLVKAAWVEQPNASPNGNEARNGNVDFRALLKPFWMEFPSADVVVLAPTSRIRELVDAVKAGASNYLTYPLNSVEVKYVLDSLHLARRSEYELDYLRRHFWHSDSLDLVRTRNPVMKEIFEKIRRVAPTKTTVLLTGETGTGKGVLARLIHNHSGREQFPFISVHCGAIPETLLESELFGHEKGAFTGAVRRKPGKFEIAQKGTLFLDEIGTMSPTVQVKLLQVLQDKTFTRVGGETVIPADVRIIAATNERMEDLKRARTLREDLFYRLNVFPIEVPPLRQRVEDIPLLAEVFLKELNRTHGKGISGIHPLVMEAFKAYSWPGNIRELHNVIERAYILENSSILTPESFPADLVKSGVGSHLFPVDCTLSLAEVRQRAADEMERRYLTQLLIEHHGSIKQTAAAAGITTRQLHKLMHKHGLRKENFRKT